MNPIVAKIERLRSRLACLNFKEYWSLNDYETEKILEREMDDLYKQLKGVKLVCARLDPDDSYLTADDSLCFGGEPTWFDSEEEAMEYFKKAQLKHDRYKLVFEWKEF